MTGQEPGTNCWWKTTGLARPRRRRHALMWRPGFAHYQSGIGGLPEALALGEQTAAVARQFGVSPGRISQLRVDFRKNWEQFQAGCIA